MKTHKSYQFSSKSSCPIWLSSSHIYLLPIFYHHLCILYMNTGNTFKLDFPFSSSLSLLPRCVVGNDWWYYGDNCQYRGSTTDKTNLALASSLSVLGVMLVITVVCVVCLKKKYKKRSNDDLVMANVHAGGNAR